MEEYKTDDRVILSLNVYDYDRICKLIERDEKNRIKARERIRSQSTNLSPREPTIKPIRYEILNNKNNIIKIKQTF